MGNVWYSSNSNSIHVHIKYTPQYICHTHELHTNHMITNMVLRKNNLMPLSVFKITHHSL